MQRNPTIKITHSDFLKVCKDYGLTATIARKLFKECGKFNIVDRIAVGGGKAKLALISKEISIESNTKAINQLNQCLTSVRAKITGINYVKVVTKGTAQYKQLDSILPLAQAFCMNFRMTQMDGFTEYLRIGIGLMGKKYGLNKFQYYNDKIFSIYKYKQELDKDTDKISTIDFYNFYREILISRIGVEYSIEESDWERKIDFLYGKQEADDNKALYRDWINAQFDGLSFLDVVPEPSQLYGGKSKERYISYMSSENLTSDKSNDLLESSPYE